MKWYFSFALGFYYSLFWYNKAAMTIKPTPVRPGAGMPPLKEMKIIAMAIRIKRISNVFFILIILNG
tara:strand:- start:633 stop:833 length:201 start_codon:yes stop_codon:yes gene_type:complete